MATMYQCDGGSKVVAERTLDIKIKLEADGHFNVEIHEPESGDTKRLADLIFVPHAHPRFDAAIGQAIYDWICIMDEARSESE